MFSNTFLKNEDIIKVKSIECILYLVCFSVALSLISMSVGRTAFYIAFYLSLLGLFVNFNYVKSQIFDKKAILYFFIITLFFSLSKIVWAISTDIDPLSNNYLRSGYRLICSSIVFCYVFAYRDVISKQFLSKLRIVLYIGFVLTSLYGFYSFITIDGRLVFHGSATLSAYIYIMQSLLVLYFLSLDPFRYHKTIFCVFSIIAFIIIMMMGTRAVIIIYPFLLVPLLLKLKLLNFTRIFIVVLTIILATIFVPSFKKMSIERMDEISSDLSQYQEGNSITSLGIRFDLWQSGIKSFAQSPYGQSIEQRYDFIKEDLNKKNKYNKDISYNLNYHLHNDIIDTLSLQGIFGVILLLLFYAVLYYLLSFYSYNHLTAILVMVPLISNGFSDALFYNFQYPLLLILTIMLYVLSGYLYDKNIDK